jgi:hypothetical protein
VMVHGQRATHGEPRTALGRGRVGFAAGALVLVAALTGCTNSPSRSATSTSTSRAVGSRLAPTSTSTTTTAPATSTSAAAQTALRDGPGPQSTYTVQPQPAPGSCHYGSDGGDPLPDLHCTPGALNPQVTQSTIGSTICRTGYSSSIRPPESITEPEKRASAAAYTYTGSFSTGEYDHLVSLELGGDPNDVANLWVEPNDRLNATSTYNSKDTLENKLHSLVCAGQLSLATAQSAIASNWVNAYHQYVGALTSSPPASAPTPAASPPLAGAAATCTASAAPANNGYREDYYVTVASNQPDQKAVASDARDSWSETTDGAGNAKILLYYVTSGEQITVTVGAASCSTVAP